MGILIFSCFCCIERVKDNYCDLPSPPLPFDIEGSFWKDILTPLEIEYHSLDEDLLDISVLLWRLNISHPGNSGKWVPFTESFVFQNAILLSIFFQNTWRWALGRMLLGIGLCFKMLSRRSCNGILKSHRLLISIRRKNIRMKNWFIFSSHIFFLLQKR